MPKLSWAIPHGLLVLSANYQKDLITLDICLGQASGKTADFGELSEVLQSLNIFEKHGMTIETCFLKASVNPQHDIDISQMVF